MNEKKEIMNRSDYLKVMCDYQTIHDPEAETTHANKAYIEIQAYSHNGEHYLMVPKTKENVEFALYVERYRNKLLLNKIKE
jgi:predicted protein tyrosine phosphatase